VRLIVAVFVKFPEEPLIVNVTVPVFAVPVAVIVNVLAAVAGFGLNDAVTPLGRPDADKVTVPLKPFCGVTVIVLAPPPPCTMLRLFGDAESVKFGGPVTARVIVAVFVKLPDVPVIVTGTVPMVAVLLAVNVSVLVVVAGFGLNEAVTPLDSPDADKLTGPLKPACGVIVIVLVPLAPWAMLMLVGDVERA
jgi:hypothetical protein